MLVMPEVILLLVGDSRLFSWVFFLLFQIVEKFQKYVVVLQDVSNQHLNLMKLVLLFPLLVVVVVIQ